MVGVLELSLEFLPIFCVDVILLEPLDDVWRLTLVALVVDGLHFLE